jgi:hypothetical protein
MGGGGTKEAVVNVGNSLVAEAYITATFKCQIQVKANQSMVFECDPQLKLKTGTLDFYEENPGCIKCLDDILVVNESDERVWKTGWSAGRTATGANETTSFEQATAAFQNCAKTICKACLWENNLQLSAIQFDSKCKFDISVIQNMAQNVEANISQSLVDNQDVLSSLAQAMGAKTNISLVANLSSKVMSRFSVNILAEISDKINANQQMNFENTDAKGVRQDSSNKLVSDFISENKFVNNVLSDNQWKVYQQIKNDQNTIGDLGDSLSKTTLTLGEVLNSVVGQVLVITIILVGIIIIVVSGLAIYKAIKATKKD